LRDLLHREALAPKRLHQLVSAVVDGVLSTLSPCVLPIVPILLGSAANAHPKAPLALAGA